MKDGDIVQVAHVVRDLDRAMKYYWDTFRIGPWGVYRFEPPDVRESTVRGEPAEFKYLVAITDFHLGPQMELMQPVSGRSILDEHLERKGEGFHHIKMYFADCQAAVKRFAAQGVGVLQSGKYDADEFYFLDTEKVFGAILELGNVGKIRTPFRTYPS